MKLQYDTYLGSPATTEIIAFVDSSLSRTERDCDNFATVEERLDKITLAMGKLTDHMAELGILDARDIVEIFAPHECIKNPKLV